MRDIEAATLTRCNLIRHHRGNQHPSIQGWQEFEEMTAVQVEERRRIRDDNLRHP